MSVIELARARNLKVGEEIGIISLNDTPIKKILEGGITVISSDFVEMGKKAAELILNGEIKQFPNSYKLIVRQSL